MNRKGLPTRLEQYPHLLRTLRDHIEARESDSLEPGYPLDVDEEIERVTKIYQEVRQTVQDNAPGTGLLPGGMDMSLPQEAGYQLQRCTSTKREQDG